jgi:hypothetical protein
MEPDISKAGESVKISRSSVADLVVPHLPSLATDRVDLVLRPLINVAEGDVHQLVSSTGHVLAGLGSATT